MKRMFCVLLALVMVLSLAPVTLASGEAEEPAAAEEPPVGEAEAEPGEEEPALDGDRTGRCGDSVYWRLEDGVMTFTGSGPMWDYYDDVDMRNREWNAFSDEIVSVVIKSGITYIGIDAFSNLGSLKTVDIASTVKTVGIEAFAHCAKLESVFLSEGVEAIGGHGFYYCENLKSITLPATLKSVGINAFMYANELSVVYNGTEAMWNRIDINPNNPELLTAPKEFKGLAPRFTVTFSANGHGSDPAPQTVDMWSTAAEPAKPTAGGYEFVAWCEDAEGEKPFDFDTPITENITLYAAWAKREPVVLTRIDFASLETELTGGEPFPNAFGVPADGSHITNPIYYWTDARGNLAFGIPEKGRYYWLNVYIEPDAGYTFGEAGTEVPVYVDGVYVGGGMVENDVYGKAELLHLKLQRLGPAAVIRAAGISLTAPVAGAVIPSKPDGTPDTGSQFIVSEQFWSTDMSTSGRLTSGTFTAGTTYYYYAKLKPDSGYEFAGTPGSVSADELTVMGNSTPAYSVSKGSDGSVTVYIPFKAVGAGYSGNISLTGFMPPKAGSAVSSGASAAGSGYAITDQGWADSIPVLFITKTKDTVFQAGKTYYWVVTVKLTGGSAFPEGYAGKVTVNGKTIPYLSAVDKLTAVLNGETPQGGWDVNAGTDTMTIAYAYRTRGDVNNDGKADGKDAALILRYCAGLIPASALDTEAADVDADGRITPNDAAVILSLS